MTSPVCAPESSQIDTVVTPCLRYCTRKWEGLVDSRPRPPHLSKIHDNSHTPKQQSWQDDVMHWHSSSSPSLSPSSSNIPRRPLLFPSNWWLWLTTSIIIFFSLIPYSLLTPLLHLPLSQQHTTVRERESYFTQLP